MEGKYDDVREENNQWMMRLKVNMENLNCCKHKFNFLIFTVNKTRMLIKLKSYLDSIWGTSVCVFLYKRQFVYWYANQPHVISSSLIIIFISSWFLQKMPWMWNFSAEIAYEGCCCYWLQLHWAYYGFNIFIFA